MTLSGQIAGDAGHTTVQQTVILGTRPDYKTEVKTLYFCANMVVINLLKPTGHVMHQQFNIQQLYVLPTLYLCVLYLSENKQRLVPLTAQTDWFL
jgi:hypothetical protein